MNIVSAVDLKKWLTHSHFNKMLMEPPDNAPIVTTNNSNKNMHEELARMIIKSLPKDEQKELGPRYFYKDSQYRAFQMDNDKAIAFIENRLTGTKGHLNIAVHPNYRGKGHAEKLVKKAIKDAPALGAEKIYWITTPENKTSKKLAEKVGFTLKNESDDEARYIYDLNGG